MAAPRLLLLPAAPISPVQGGLLFHGGEEGDAEMAVKGQIDDDIPGRVDVTALSADVLDHQSSGDQDVPALVGQTPNAFRDGFTEDLLYLKTSSCSLHHTQSTRL